MMKRNKATEDEDYVKVKYDDDGGAAKNDDRRIRRMRRRWAYPVLIFLGFLVILYYIGGRSSSAHEGGIMVKDKKRPNNMISQPKRHKTQQRLDSDEKPAHFESFKFGLNDGDTIDDGKYRWSNPRVLPPAPGFTGENILEQTIAEEEMRKNRQLRQKDARYNALNFKVRRGGDPAMEWEAEADDEMTGGEAGPVLDYTTHPYDYPDLLSSPPGGGQYPPLEKLSDIYKRWPQDEIDNPPSPIVERLLHFDYSNPEEMEVAIKFRDAELPFKVYNVPEVDAATLKWTDEYVASNFVDKRGGRRARKPLARGHAQESIDNFFAFYTPMQWNIETMGPPPTVDNDWNYETWAKHARYADAVQLPFNEPHYYWQAGVPREERLQPKNTWCFVSLDLPSFSNPEPTFFGFEPMSQKGIQCRFGERGVTAATHYDTGRNMIAMITGAKRYILAPPRECSKLGIVTKKNHPTYRHSLLNFGHISLLDDPAIKSMPAEERRWLEVASDSLAIDTVLNAGEVLYVPAHWFHYITSLQKSAQCNTRSGIPKKSHPVFGGIETVKECVDVNE